MERCSVRQIYIDVQFKALSYDHYRLLFTRVSLSLYVLHHEDKYCKSFGNGRIVINTLRIRVWGEFRCPNLLEQGDCWQYKYLYVDV